MRDGTAAIGADELNARRFTSDVWRIDVGGGIVKSVIVDRGVVILASPEFAWSINRPWPDVRAEMKRRGWHGRKLELA